MDVDSLAEYAVLQLAQVVAYDHERLKVMVVEDVVGMEEGVYPAYGVYCQK